jgi:hypothetical protein
MSGSRDSSQAHRCALSRHERDAGAAADEGGGMRQPEGSAAFAAAARARADHRMPAHASRPCVDLLHAYRDVAVRDLAWLLLSPSLLDARYFGPRLAHMLAQSQQRQQTLAWLTRLDADPRALHVALDARPQSRLGLYAEQLLGFFLQHGPATRLIAANRPVRVDGHTLGECDFLFEDDGARAWHWELTVKCYLDAGGPPGSLARYVGPNLADRFDRKLTRLLTHQLTLSQHPQIAALAADGHWQAAMIVRGWLFRRWDPSDVGDSDPVSVNHTPRGNVAPGPIAPDHLQGWWTCAAQWPVFDAPAWTIVPRLGWMAPLRLSADDPRVYRDSTAVLVRCIDYWRDRPDQPLMVAALDDVPVSQGVGNPAGELCELARGFIVPDDWPKRAAAYTTIP